MLAARALACGYGAALMRLAGRACVPNETMQSEARALQGYRLN